MIEYVVLDKIGHELYKSTNLNDLIYKSNQIPGSSIKSKEDQRIVHYYDDSKNEHKNIKNGQRIKLENAPLYFLYKGTSHTSILSGYYYVLDKNPVNGRYMITDNRYAHELNNKKKYKLGWVDMMDIIIV